MVKALSLYFFYHSSKFFKTITVFVMNPEHFFFACCKRQWILTFSFVFMCDVETMKREFLRIVHFVASIKMFACGIFVDWLFLFDCWLLVLLLTYILSSLDLSHSSVIHSIKLNVVLFLTHSHSQLFCVYKVFHFFSISHAINMDLLS